MHCTGSRFVGTCEFLFTIHLPHFDNQIMTYKYYFEQVNYNLKKSFLSEVNTFFYEY